MLDLTGKRLGQYQILEEIGHGGMAVVYKAYQPSLSRYVAIKVLVSHLSQDTEFIERFRREALAAGKLDHPNIIHVYDVGQEGTLHYLVMSYVAGSSLAAKLKREGALGARTALSILQQVGSALDYAHVQGVIHRDVKPSNILFAADGRAVLTDFGIAKPLADSRLTQTGVAVGTPAYMSPEQAKGETLDGRSDLYSLGIVLYEMLTGRVPFQADTSVAILYKQVHEDAVAPSQVNPAISAHVDRVILRALQKDRNRRYASAGEMAHDFAQAVSGGSRAAGARLRPMVRQEERATERYAPGKPPIGVRPAAVPQGRSIPVPLMAAIAGLAIIAVVWLVARLVGGGGPVATPVPPTEIAQVSTVPPSAPPATPSPAPPTLAPTRPQPTDTPRPSATPAPPPSSPTPTLQPTLTRRPASPTPDRAAREAAVLSRLRYHQDNGPVVFAYRTDRPPAINGSLNDWQGHFYGANTAVFGSENWRGAQDLSGSFSTAWDPTYLYLAVNVVDDLHVQTSTGRTIHLGDEVEVQFDRELQAHFYSTGFQSDDRQIHLSPGDFGSRSKEALIWDLGAMVNWPGSAIQLEAVQTADGYIIEAAIPWSILDAAPQSGMAYGFCCNLSDNDDPYEAKQETECSSSPQRKWENPATWGTLVLMDEG